jgi:hypothetical protein
MSLGRRGRPESSTHPLPEPESGDDDDETDFSMVNKPSPFAPQYFREMCMQLKALALDYAYGEASVPSDSDEESIFADSDEKSICQPNDGSGDDVQLVRLPRSEVESTVARVKWWLENRWCLSDRPSLLESAKDDRAEIEELGLVTICREAASRDVAWLEKRIKLHTADIMSLPWWNTKVLELSSFANY